MGLPLNTRPTGDSETLGPGESPLDTRTTLAPGTVLTGRYRIRALIGEGGMGDVYLATHLAIDKDVAIKVLAPEQMRRPRTVSRFLQEAKAASRIRHPNVVDINDYGESEGCAFFVMEYLEGEDLSAMVKREGRQPWSRIKPICTQLLRALAAAHAAGIVHRDIKPHNCFLTPREGNPDFVKVIDFGIAKVRDGSEEQLTRTGAIMGTAEYMSPEQGQGTELDGRSDLYSVGVILYRLLTGAVPFKGSNPMAILYQHIHAERIPPSQACPEANIDPRIDALVLRALAKDPDDRFASAEEFITAVAAIEDEPLGAAAAAATMTAPAPAWWQRPSIAAGGLALLVVGAGAAWWLLRDPAPVVESAAAEPPSEPGPSDPAAVGATGAAEPAAAGSTASGEATAGSGAATGESDPGTGAAEPGDETSAEPATTGEPAGDSSKPPASLPLRRSSRVIHGRLGRIASKVRACGKKAGLFPGESVTVQVKIAPSGRVLSAKVMGAFSRKGAACIEQAARGVRFSAVQQVQTAEHRFKL